MNGFGTGEEGRKINLTTIETMNENSNEKFQRDEKREILEQNDDKSNGASTTVPISNEKRIFRSIDQRCPIEGILIEDAMWGRATERMRRDKIKTSDLRANRRSEEHRTGSHKQQEKSERQFGLEEIDLESVRERCYSTCFFSNFYFYETTNQIHHYQQSVCKVHLGFLFRYRRHCHHYCCHRYMRMNRNHVPNLNFPVANRIVHVYYHWRPHGDHHVYGYYYCYYDLNSH